ncbi:hydroxymethylpyrimidine pyrophosphatase-like HAD family hydrolase [Frondihabitans sp. PhB161]|nr:hydroxymethylpyrimidine pyrophosphatase-like HAD family hydrolase [Frondihabitans sp. PhB153]RPF07838.1 hydroxymethylpyrimidine pyrophosphatase-like HAD family hydrolase [Frondihabitans sp. PhB161]
MIEGMPSTSAPALGLLLDVDGPIASPITRTIDLPAITRDLVALADAGIPLVFNTGRSDAFIREEVVGPLIAAGLPDHARVHGVCEKGAVWFSIGPRFDGGMGELEIDESLAMPADFAAEMEAVVAERFADRVFFDRTKRAMVSVEQLTSIENSTYVAMQPLFDEVAREALARRGFGVRRLDDVRPDAHGDVQWRIDPTIISTDIESVLLGKDLGARRALELLALDGELPLAWRTVGDSRSDYAMADWLHAGGYEVEHVDVRPGDGVPEKAYPIRTSATGAIHDGAGAEFLAEWLTQVS